MKTDNVLVVFALKSESQGFIESLGFNVLYCGVGKVNAAYQMTRYIYEAHASGGKPTLVINCGSVGSRTFKQGDLVEAHTAVQRDIDATALGFPLGTTPFDDIEPILAFPKQFPGLKSAICGTGDSFAQDEPLVACNVVDMEAYALAKVCHQQAIGFTSLKYVTDGADKNAHIDWQENLSKAAKAFAMHLTCYR